MQSFFSRLFSILYILIIVYCPTTLYKMEKTSMTFNIIDGSSDYDVNVWSDLGNMVC